MPDYPLLMSMPLVRALLDGRKTQSRRLPTPAWAKAWRAFNDGQPVQLWVREAGFFPPPPGAPIYRADLPDGAPPPAGLRWSPSIHMPRFASRLTLVATDLRRERLSAISDADCRAEGARPSVGEAWPPAFGRIWDRLHDRSGERWRDDPEVYVLAFTVHHGNIDGLRKAGSTE